MSRVSLSDATARRRHFTGEYKALLLEALDRCADRGEASALLRQERLHWSHVAAWRKQRDANRLEDSWTSRTLRARLDALGAERAELLAEIRELESANEALRATLSSASVEPRTPPRRRAPRGPDDPAPAASPASP